jgi:DNA-binding transcriptional regulator GbsR (MarR family)
MEHAKLIELLGKRWNMLRILSRKEHYVSELARILKSNKPQTSVTLRELERENLVELASRKPQRLKYYRATDYAQKLMDAIDEVTAEKTSGKLEEWRIDELVSVVKDDKLAENVRVTYSEALSEVCTSHLAEAIQIDEVRRLLEEVAKEPYKSPVNKPMARRMHYILSLIPASKENEEWVVKKLYPIFLQNTKSKDERVRTWAVAKIMRVAQLNNQVRADTIRELLKIWFSKDFDPSSQPGLEIRQELSVLASKALFKELRKKATVEDPKTRVKAETLLKTLRDCLLQNESESNAEKQVLVV